VKLVPLDDAVSHLALNAPVGGDWYFDMFLSWGDL
jgi:hypothetical protein